MVDSCSLEDWLYYKAVSSPPGRLSVLSGWLFPTWQNNIIIWWTPPHPTDRVHYLVDSSPPDQLVVLYACLMSPAHPTDGRGFSDGRRLLQCTARLRCQCSRWIPALAASAAGSAPANTTQWRTRPWTGSPKRWVSAWLRTPGGSLNTAHFQPSVFSISCRVVSIWHHPNRFSSCTVPKPLILSHRWNMAVSQLQRITGRVSNS